MSTNKVLSIKNTRHFSRQARQYICAQQQVNRLVGEDIDTAMSLGPLDDNTILSCFTPATKLSAGKRSWLYAIRDWFRQRQLVVGYGNFSSSEFTLTQLELMLKKAGDIKLPNSDISSNNKDIRAPADPWNGKPDTWWRKKKREFMAFIAMQKNRNGVPLSYLLRDNAINDYNSEGDTRHAMIRHAPLEGDIFNGDNYTLYQILVSWTSEGSAEAFVDRFASTTNGRAAWINLVLAN